ncbi:hypothetical protein ABIB26_004162 [Arthrobacter sp. UYEF20]
MLNDEYALEIWWEHPHIRCQGAGIRSPIGLEPHQESVFSYVRGGHVMDGRINAPLVVQRRRVFGSKRAEPRAYCRVVGVDVR